MHSRFTKWNSQ